MPRSRRILAIILVLPIVGAVLAGCTAAPEPIVLEPGECIAEAFNNQPVRDTVVECSEPHRFDIVATLGAWPDASTAIATNDAASVYERLVRADPSDELVSAFHDWAMPQCAAAFDELVGVSAIAIEDISRENLGLRPTGPWWLTATLDTGARFAAGDHTVVCAVGWLDDASELRSVSYGATVTIADLLTAAFPLDLRTCFDFGEGDARVPANCLESHSGQELVTINAATALGADWVSEVDPATGRADDYRPADAVCQDVTTALIPGDALGDDLKVWADIAPTDGWVGFDGTVVEGAGYPISCSVIGPRGSMLEGDILGGAAAVTVNEG